MKTFLTLFLMLFYSQVFAQQELQLSNSAKSTLAKNPKLESVVYQYLDYSSCHSKKKQDFIKLYSILSQEYLAEHFPNINSAQEYSEDMRDSSEIYHLVYHSIDQVLFTNNNATEVTLTFESGNEGVIDKMKKTILFKQKNDIWLYDGLKEDSLKYIETLE